MLREAFALAAKGYHLRKITEQITAVEHLKRSLAHAMTHLHDDMTRGAPEGPARLTASLREVVAQVQREYGAIHHDFRHEVDDALATFVQALAPVLQTCHWRRLRRFSSATWPGHA